MFLFLLLNFFLLYFLIFFFLLNLLQNILLINIWKIFHQLAFCIVHHRLNKKWSSFYWIILVKLSPINLNPLIIIYTFIISSSLVFSAVNYNILNASSLVIGLWVKLAAYIVWFKNSLKGFADFPPYSNHLKHTYI